MINKESIGDKWHKAAKKRNLGSRLCGCFSLCLHACDCMCVCVCVCVIARAPDAQMMNGLLSQKRQCSDTEDLRSHC